MGRSKKRIKEAYICLVCDKILYKDKYTKKQADKHANIPIKDFNFPENAVFKKEYIIPKGSQQLVMILRKSSYLAGGRPTENHEQIYNAHLLEMDGTNIGSKDIICNEETKKNLKNLTENEIKNIKDGSVYRKEQSIFDFKLK